MIRSRMLGFAISYEEIYHELLDHITSAVEDARSKGDIRPATDIFEYLTANRFGGAAGIKKMARQQAQLYRLKIDKEVRKAMSSYLWQKAVGVLLLTITVEFLLPDNGDVVFWLYGV